MRSLPRRAPLAILATALAACSASVSPLPSQPLPLPPPPPVVVASPPPASAPPVSSSPRELTAPDSDEDLAKLLHEAMSCPWDNALFSGKCAAMDAWLDAKELFADGKADTNLVIRLEDPDLKVRLLATQNLDKYGRVFRTDPALAERVVTVTERERQKQGPLAALLGRIVGTIDVERTGLTARVEALVQTHPRSLVRSYLVQSLPRHNPTSAAVRRMVQAAVQDPDWEVRGSAAGAYLFVDEGGAESCAFWAANLAHPDGRVVAEVASGLSQDRCAQYQDRLLTTLERSDVALTPYTSFPRALEDLCKGSTARPKDRLRAAAVARRIAANDASRGCISDSTPVQALDAVVACDPKSARAYLGRFLKAPEGAVQQRAVQLYKELR